MTPHTVLYMLIEPIFHFTQQNLTNLQLIWDIQKHGLLSGSNNKAIQVWLADRMCWICSCLLYLSKTGRKLQDPGFKMQLFGFLSLPSPAKYLLVKWKLWPVGRGGWPGLHHGLHLNLDNNYYTTTNLGGVEMIRSAEIILFHQKMDVTHTISIFQKISFYQEPPFLS
jgi:hypothetical protein